jgi:hypothetical protein
MAKILSKTGITNGDTIEVSHITQSIDALTGVEAYDITISGSLILSGSTEMVGNATTATSASHAVKANSATTSSYALSATSASYATNATNIGVDSVGAEEVYLLMVENKTGTQGTKTDDDLTYNSSTNALTATTFVGALSGNATTATSASHAVNADSATTASYALSGGETVDTGSLLNNAQKDEGSENTITFTKGDNTTFDVTLPAIPTTFTSVSPTDSPFINTPDETGKTPAGWVDIMIGGTKYYIPVWADSE